MHIKIIHQSNKLFSPTSFNKTKVYKNVFKRAKTSFSLKSNISKK